MGGRSAVAVGVAAVLLGGCLTRSQGAGTAAAGAGVLAGTFIVLGTTGCQERDFGCGLEKGFAGAIPFTIGSALLIGGLVNVVFGPDHPPERHRSPPLFVPSLARYLMASAGVTARRGDCATARELAARARATDPVVADAYAGDPALAACLAAR